MSALLAAFICTAPVAVDGDTLRCNGIGLVRLIGIDAPELPGHCRRGRHCVQGDGEKSRAALAEAIHGRAVRCRPEGRDAYERVLARCAAAGTDLSCAQLEGGFAVRRYGVIWC